MGKKVSHVVWYRRGKESALRGKVRELWAWEKVRCVGWESLCLSSHNPYCAVVTSWQAARQEEKERQGVRGEGRRGGSV